MSIGSIVVIIGSIVVSIGSIVVSIGSSVVSIGSSVVRMRNRAEKDAVRWCHLILHGTSLVR